MGSSDRAAARPGAASASSGELFESYARAVYRVDSPEGPIFLHVGEASAGLDRWLEAHGARRFAFLSAANPGSVELPEAENRLRHLRLLGRLEATGLAAVGGESFEAESGGFREASLLVIGIDREAAIALARDFGQAALLWGETGEPVELLRAAVSDPRDSRG